MEPICETSKRTRDSHMRIHRSRERWQWRVVVAVITEVMLKEVIRCNKQARDQTKWRIGGKRLALIWQGNAQVSRDTRVIEGEKSRGGLGWDAGSSKICSVS